MRMELASRREALEESCGGEGLSMSEVYGLMEIDVEEITFKVLKVKDYSYLSWKEADYIPKWLKDIRRAPQKLKEYIKEHLSCEDDQAGVEREALDKLIKRYGGLDSALNGIKDLEQALRAAKLRELRFEMDPLLKRRNLEEMGANQLRVLVVALQNELSACYSYVKDCNLIQHPLIQGVLKQTNGEAEERVFQTPPVKSHLIDLTKLNLLCQDTRTEDLLGEHGSEKVKEQRERDQNRSDQYFQDVKSSISATQAEIKGCLKDIIDYRQKVVGNVYQQHNIDANEDVAGSHPAGWLMKQKQAKMEERVNEQIVSLQKVCEKMETIRAKVDIDMEKLRADLGRRDSIIEMQQDIEQQLIKSKRETSSINIQLASLFLRMIYHVYPDMWQKIAHATSNDNLEPDMVLNWEAENDIWLKKWLNLVLGKPNGEESDQDDVDVDFDLSSLGLGGVGDVAFPVDEGSFSPSFSPNQSARDKNKSFVFKPSSPPSSMHAPTGSSKRKNTVSVQMLQNVILAERKKQQQAERFIIRMMTQSIEPGVEKQSTGIVQKLIDDAKNHFKYIGISNRQQLLDTVIEFAFDTSIVPNLISQHQAGLCFGVAESRLTTRNKLQGCIKKLKQINVSDRRNTVRQVVKEQKEADEEEKISSFHKQNDHAKTLIMMWLEECAMLAYNKSKEPLAVRVRTLVQHVRSHLETDEKKLMMKKSMKMKAANAAAASLNKPAKPHRPKTAVGSRTSSSDQKRDPRTETSANTRSGSSKPKKQDVTVSAPSGPMNPGPSVSNDDALLFGIFLHYAVHNHNARASSFSDMQQNVETIPRPGVLQFAAEYQIVPDLMSKADLNVAILSKLPIRLSYQDFIKALNQIASYSSKKLMVDPFLSFYKTNANASANDPVKPFDVLFALLEKLTLTIHGPFLKTQGRQELQFRMKLAKTVRKQTGGNLDQLSQYTSNNNERDDAHKPHPPSFKKQRLASFARANIKDIPL